ncbi:phosphatidic acid phosphatase [Novymonas esmeraldas]|uniref:Phosphatidic acid phosphatase n=1 Tax=Novymonas esmeraldas TaxID=1808958 RepID=A0AAW0EUA8_9TRYP
MPSSSHDAGQCSVAAVWRLLFFFRLHDYILCLACGLIAYGVSRVRPHCRPFSWTDPTIDFPYGGAGTFPSWTLAIISVLPGVAYVLGEAVRHLWLGRRSGGVLAWAPYTRRTRLRWRRPRGESGGGDEAVSTAGADGGRRGAADAPPLPLSESSAAAPSTSGTPGSIVVVTEDVVPSAERDAQVGSPTQPRHLAPSPLPAKVEGGADSAAHVYTVTRSWQWFLVHAHMWILTQAFSITFAMLVVDTVKVYAGRLRPDFLSRLRNSGYSPSSVGVDWCAVALGGRVSFPSGHSGISFAAFVPLCYYVLHTLHAFRTGGVSLWRTVAGLVPLILPITVAVSRTRDFRHNYDDVVAGSAIGIASAMIAVKATMSVDGRTGQLVPRFASGE